MDEQGTVSQASVEAAIQQIAGGGSSNKPQHVTVIDAFQVRAACTCASISGNLEVPCSLPQSICTASSVVCVRMAQVAVNNRGVSAL
jgi:hypothetical protein